MTDIQINGRFKLYSDLVLIERDVWQLSTFNNGSKRIKPMRKLKYYEKRKSYGYNRSYISKDRLLKLFIASKETINKRESNNF